MPRRCAWAPPRPRPSYAAPPGRTSSILPTRPWQSLGKRVTTVFLCGYLHDQALRREINDGLNVVEHWNGASTSTCAPGSTSTDSKWRLVTEVLMLVVNWLVLLGGYLECGEARAARLGCGSAGALLRNPD